MDEATVVDVVDGDTIKVGIAGTTYTVRYIGIDRPETVDPNSPVMWMGPEASAANEQLVAGQLTLERDVSETDRFGRLLRYVWLSTPAGWLMVNEELVRLGSASSSSYPPDVHCQDRFVAAQREAADGGEACGFDSGPPTRRRPRLLAPRLRPGRAATQLSGSLHPARPRRTSTAVRSHSEFQVWRPIHMGSTATGTAWVRQLITKAIR